MDMKRRRSSSSITLVLISASALTACSQQSTETMQRDMYASKTDCVQDWGSDPSKCEPVQQSGRTGPPYTHYYGPMYNRGSYGSNVKSPNSTAFKPGAVSSPRPGSRATGTAHVSRSGFGSSSSSHSSSGSRASSS